MIGEAGPTSALFRALALSLVMAGAGLFGVRVNAASVARSVANQRRRMGASGVRGAGLSGVLTFAYVASDFSIAQ